MHNSMPVLAVLALLLPAASMTAEAEDGEVTFSRDVAPVFFQHCVGCHRPGEVAPMSLLSYQEARPWAKSIRKMVQQRLMPPWGTDPHIGSWANDMSLSDDQISTVVAWVEQGAAEGEAVDLPEAPVFTEGWQLGEPDLVIELDPVEVWADGEDLFPEQWVDVGLEETKWVRAMEFLPGDRRVTHHFLSTYSTGRASATGSGKEFDSGAGRGGSGIFGVWTAGMQPYVFPAGMGRLIGPGTRILMNSHYHPIGEDTVDRTRIGLHFGKGELQKEVSTLAVVNTGLRIPPGDPDYGVIGFHVFDNDSRLIAFSPHLHVRGKAMKYELIEPDGERRTLLDVPRYNYNYQWLYYPTEPIAVPAGSKLEVTARWDNSAENASNPDPSAEIVYRGDTFNEMFVGFFEAYEDEGVYANPLPAVRKLTQLLAEHPATDSYLVPGMLPLGLYIPRQGQGWVYTGRIQLVVATSRDGGVSMGVGKCQGAIRAMRGQMRSPGRPSTARREDRIRFWETIARGASSEDAATEAGVSPAVGSRWFRQAGGMRPISLAPVSGRYLSFAEREEIAILHAQHVGVREIARRLGRSPSTISRELRRNAATRSRAVTYRATTAQWHAERRASRPKVSKLAANDALREYVQNRLAGVIARPDGELVPGPDVRWIGRRHGRRQDRRWAKSWSPEQISNRLRIDFPHNESMRISHEAIYQALYIQGRGALKRELVACLRTGRALRVPHARTRGRGKKFVTPEIMISERPAEAADRAVPGHWEGDLIVGLESSAIGTLVERTTRFTMLLHLPRMEGHGTESRVKNGPALAGHGAEAVRDAIAVSITTLPEQLRRSLTWDQGAEMAQHAQLRVDTGLAIYFCDPHSPWQRGTNENTNGLLRQYFPKGTDLVRYSCDDLAAVALALNGRPRKTLGWRTPAEVFDELVHSAHQGNAATTP